MKTISLGTARTLSALVVAGALVLGGCSSGDTAGDSPSTGAITVGEQTTTAGPTTTGPTTAGPTTTGQTSTEAEPTSSNGPGDYEVGHGLVLTLPEGWKLSTSNSDDDDDEHFHGFTHEQTGGQLAVMTDDDMDDSPAEECADVQDEMEDDFKDNGPVTKTQGTAHSDNAHTCGVTAKDDKGNAIEITIFIAKGSNAVFMTAAKFPTSPPEGATQDDLDRAVREASTMSSQLLTNLD